MGAGKLVDPFRITHVFVSPRARARKTFELLQLPPSDTQQQVTYTEDIAEWDYGDYEGLKVHEIRDLRKERGLDQERAWDIWRDGCEGGEYDAPFFPMCSKLILCLRSMKQVTERLDKLIMRIRDIQRPCMKGERPADVLLVSSFFFFPLFSQETPSLIYFSPLYPIIEGCR